MRQKAEMRDVKRLKGTQRNGKDVAQRTDVREMVQPKIIQQEPHTV